MSTKILPTNKMQYVRTIAKMRLNNTGADIYTTKSGTAYIICDKLGSQIPFANIEFTSLDELENWIDAVPGSGAGKLANIIDTIVP